MCASLNMTQNYDKSNVSDKVKREEEAVHLHA